MLPVAMDHLCARGRLAADQHPADRAFVLGDRLGVDRGRCDLGLVFGACEHERGRENAAPDGRRAGSQRHTAFARDSRK